MKHPQVLSSRIFKNNRGFTLVEVLISMVIFSLLMVLVSNSISYATRYWTKEHGNLTQKISEFVYTEKLYRSIAAAQPYAVFSGRSENLRLFFKGSNQQTTFVSSVGLYEQGPVIISIRIAEDTELGGVQIQVAEEPISSTMLNRDSDVNTINWNWKTLKSNLVSAKIRYYGYDSLSDLKIDRASGRSQQVKMGWYDDYNGENRKVSPLKIAIQWQQMKLNNALNYVMEFPIRIDDKRRYGAKEKLTYGF